MTGNELHNDIERGPVDRDGVRRMKSEKIYEFNLMDTLL